MGELGSRFTVHSSPFTVHGKMDSCLRRNDIFISPRGGDGAFWCIEGLLFSPCSRVLEHGARRSPVATGGWLMLEYVT